MAKIISKKPKLGTLFSSINKKGVDSGVKIGFANEMIMPAAVFSMGVKGLEDAIGIGGMPRGGIVEIYGKEHIGKSFLGQKIVSHAQQIFDDRYCAYFDLESALNPDRMKTIGINTEELIAPEIENCEDVFEILYKLIEANAISVAVVDSVAAMRTRSENEGKIGDPTFRRAAGVLSSELPKLARLCVQNGVTVIFTNQVRDSMNVVGGRKMEHTVGGRALKFYAHLRIELKPVYDNFKIIDSITKRFLGQNIRCKITKNRYAPPDEEVEFPLYVAEPDYVYEIYGKGRKEKLISSRLGTFTYIDLAGEKHVTESESDMAQLLAVNGLIREVKNRINPEIIPEYFNEVGFERQIKQRIDCLEIDYDIQIDTEKSEALDIIEGEFEESNEVLLDD